MVHTLMFIAALCHPAGEQSAPEHVTKYLQRCDAAKAAAIAAKEEEIKLLARQPDLLARQPDAKGELRKKLQAARDALTRLREQPAPLLPLPLPPQKADMGVFEPASPKDRRRGRAVDVLEVVDQKNAIVRAWFPGPTATDEPTFVDLWLQGIDTSGLKAGATPRLAQVFYVAGNKLIDTTCGKRSLPLLEVIKIEQYRSTIDKKAGAPPTTSCITSPAANGAS